MSDIKVQGSRFVELNWQRNIFKRKRVETQLKENQLEGHLEEEKYFKTPDSADIDDKAKEFINYVDYGSGPLQFDKIKPDITRLANNQFISKYLSEFVLDEILLFLDGQDEDSIVDLYDSLLEANEGMESEIINKYVSTWKLSIAQIYMVIGYLRDKLIKEKKRKENLETILAELLRKIELQNSNYLLNFFDLSNQVKITKNHKLIHSFAALSSGEQNVKTLRDALSFVDSALMGDFTQIVSRCVMCRIGVLARLSSENLSLEEKVQLADYYNFEKNLIILNSIYTKLIGFKNNLKKNNLWNLDISVNLSTISSILTFTESSIISESLLSTLLKQMKLDVNFKLSPGIINNLINLLHDMPISIFNNLPKQYEKILDGLRGISRNNNLDVRRKNSFNFIRETKEKKQFI
jgi:hypothetical protein